MVKVTLSYNDDEELAAQLACLRIVNRICKVKVAKKQKGPYKKAYITIERKNKCSCNSDNKVI